MPEEAKKTLTIRLPESLYSSAAELAKRRGVSLNHLVQEGLSAVIQGEQYGLLFDAFGLVASTDADEPRTSAQGGTSDAEK